MYKSDILLFQYFSIAFPRVSNWLEIAGTWTVQNSHMQYNPYEFLPFGAPNGEFNSGH